MWSLMCYDEIMIGYSPVNKDQFGGKTPCVVLFSRETMGFPHLCYVALGWQGFVSSMLLPDEKKLELDNTTRMFSREWLNK